MYHSPLTKYPLPCHPGNYNLLIIFSLKITAMIDDAARDTGANIVPGSAEVSVSPLSIVTMVDGFPTPPASPVLYSANITIQSEVVNTGVLRNNFFPPFVEDDDGGRNPRIVLSQENQGLLAFRQSCE